MTTKSWDTLEGSDDPPAQPAQTTIRLPRELIERLDTHVERQRKRLRMLTLTRSDVVRTLLARALDDAERER